jgi:predicted dienelactone hydrolase
MSRLVFLATCLSIVMIVRAAPAYDTGEGSLHVANASFSLHDGKRSKDLPVTAYFPKENGAFPVIVFSHGALGSGRSYVNLLSFWASRGYVCLAPTHDDSLSLHGQQIREQGGRQVAREEFTQLFHDPSGWKNRAADVSFVISSFDEIQKLEPQLKGKLDVARVGVGGHSYGAYTTNLVAGALVDLPEEKSHSFKEDRAHAFLILSGAGPAQMGLTEHSWDHCEKPMMFETGSRDPGASGEGPLWRLHAYDSCPSGDKFSVYIDNATHFTFVGRRDSKEFDVVKASSIAFWDAYLKDDPAAKAYLKSDSISHLSNNGVTFKSK